MTKRFSLFLLLFAVSLPFISGCSRSDKKIPVDKIKIIRGSGQCAMPGKKFKLPLILELQGKRDPGLFGGKGERPPAVGAQILFQPLDGSDLKVLPIVATSDSGGGVSVEIIAGNKVGDHYLQVIPADHPDKSTTIRFIVGVEIKGGRQQAPTGTKLHDPISVSIVDSHGKPLVGVPVYFSLRSSPEKRKSKAVIFNPMAVTDKNGEAKTEFKLGEKTGEYGIDVEISDPRQQYFVRGISVDAMGLNLPALIATVLGGLALFILGMKLMSDGLQHVAGQKMKTILQFFTSNRFVAVMAGALVTGVIQSSSACTVMVIGFINAGLLNLTQSIGIIFGANIGTTITAQMISFKLGFLALPAITVGLLMTLLGKDTIKGWGDTILGFGLLFFGMNLMSGELKMIGNFPSFVEFFRTFDCAPMGAYMPPGAVIGSIMIGVLMTVVIQSSSASVGIILALAASGLINFYTAMSLELGATIGTTVTAILASLAANKHAKQAAFAHFLFNFLKVIVMVGLFYCPYPGTNIPIPLYLINSITPGDVFAAVPQNIVRHIAMGHTIFNCFGVIMFIPFIKQIAMVCRWVIPVKAEEVVEVQHLEPHLLDTPAVALEQTIQTIRYMVKESWRMVCEAVGCFEQGKIDDVQVRELERRENKVDRLQEDVTDYLVQLTKRELTTTQADIVPMLMHCTNDAERIADHTENIIVLVERMHKTKAQLSDKGSKEISDMWLLVSDQAENVIACLTDSDPDNVTIALQDEQKIDRLADSLERKHMKRLSKGECDPAVSFIYMEMISELERIADHLSNIAERAPEIRAHYFELRG
jgi:phosphate:Na+ symporter